MKNLYISWYKEKDQKRQHELLFCLNRNADVFDRVFILTETELGGKLPKNHIELPVTKRPSFRIFFEVINNTSHFSDINFVANSDIYFNDIGFDVAVNQCFALTRYETNGVFLNRRDSQDVWIFKGHVRGIEEMYCRFYMGTPGCDNRIAYELRKVGYNVRNPSLTIKAYHVHAGNKEHQGKGQVRPPYLLLSPEAL